MGEWSKEDVERLANHERSAGARLRILEIKKRIEELLLELNDEQRNLEVQRRKLADANAFLRKIGETDVYDE